MNQLNSIILEGNLVREPELKELSKGLKLCEFSLGCNRYVHNNDSGFSKEVDFFKCECWNSVADYVSQNGKKGQTVRLCGRIKQNRWKDKNGKDASNIVVVCDKVEINKNQSSKTQHYTSSKETEVEEQQNPVTFEIPF